MLLDLSNRAKFKVTGKDRARYLNGQLTNDIDRLRTGSAIYACALTAKGKLCADLFVAATDEIHYLDAEPVLSDELIALGRWISGYYCSPLGEVLRSMLPLAAEIRSGKIYSLTDAGRDASKQLSIDISNDDALNQVMQMLAARTLSAAHLKRKIPLADKVLKSLERKGWIAAEQVQVERDPLRAPSAKLRPASWHRFHAGVQTVARKLSIAGSSPENSFR